MLARRPSCRPPSRSIVFALVLTLLPISLSIAAPYVLGQRGVPSRGVGVGAAPAQPTLRSTEAKHLPPEQFGRGVDGPLRVDEGVFVTNAVSTSLRGEPKGGEMEVNVASTRGFEGGDLVLFHQARGTSGVGNWSFNRLVDVTTRTLHLEIPLQSRAQSQGDQGVAGAHVVQVKEYSSCTIGPEGTVTGGSWDLANEAGGLIVLLCGESLRVDGTIDASGLGFRGGPKYHRANEDCGFTGEGSRGIPENRAMPTYGGNGGGGGGGGRGGCNTAGPGGGGAGGERGESSSQGVGGEPDGDAYFNDMMFGGGGGGPKTYDGTPLNPEARGGHGGGLIMAFARNVSGTGQILANGEQAFEFAAAEPNPQPFSGGGGGGGGVFITAGRGDLTNVTIRALGGPMLLVPSGSQNDSGGAGGMGRVRLEYCEFVPVEATPAAHAQQIYCGPRTATPPPSPTPTPTLPTTPTSTPTATPVAREACQSPVPLVPGTWTDDALTSARDHAAFTFQVDEPFTDVTLQLRDPDGVLDMVVDRTCHTVGTGTGRHIGRGVGDPRGGVREVTFNVGTDVGGYFVVVGAKDDAVDFPQPVSIHLAMTNDAGSLRTLILTDEDEVLRRNAQGPQVDAWHAAVQAFSNHDAVRGVVVWNLSDETSRLDQAYSRRVSDLSNSALANELADAISDWVWERATTDLPGIRYLVILGDDRIVPFHRAPISAPEGSGGQWRKEAEYVRAGNINGGSSTGSALLDDLTLTDDPYGAPPSTRSSPLDAFDVRLPVLPVGRLVESPGQMAALLEQFMANDGVIEVDRSLAAGYDFMADGTDGLDAALEAAGLASTQRAVLRGPEWTASEVLAHLAAPWPDVVGIAAHASHFGYDAPSGNSLGAAAIAALPTQAAPFLVTTLACHGGLSVPGDDAVPEDFPEAWGSLGGQLVGSTGWAYGMPDVLGYQERLFVDFAEQVLEGGGRPVGDALVQAKHDYYRTHSLTHYDAKTMAGTVLYGLPMARLRVSGGAIPPRLGAVTAARGGSAPAFVARAVVSPATSRRSLLASVQAQGPIARQVVSKTIPIARDALRRYDTPAGSYFAFGDHLPFAEDGFSVEPMFTQQLGDLYRDSTALALHGSVFVGGRYEYTPDEGYRPLIAQALQLGPGMRAAVQAPTRPVLDASPPLPHLARRSPDVLAAEGAGGTVAQPLTLMWYAGQVVDGRHRLYQTIASAEYYSDSDDWTPPELAGVRAVSPPGSGGQFVLEVRVASDDVDDVLATCDDGRERWALRELRRVDGAPWAEATMQTGEVWRSGVGAIDVGSRCIVQAVDAAGNVASSHAEGRYHRIPAPGGVIWLPVAGR